MDYAGYRCASSVGDVCHCACYRTCDRYPAEERYGDVCQALAYKFCVGLGVRACHAVGYGG